MHFLPSHIPTLRVRSRSIHSRSEEVFIHPMLVSSGTAQRSRNTSLSLTVLYRDGPEHYQLWQEFKSLPVISVAPVRRPKLDESGKRYSFSQEKDLMFEKMRTVLRIAAMFKHADIVLGAFGVGHIFRNPAREVARM